MTRSDFDNNEMVHDMAGMRDKLIHDYMGVDVAVVWKTIEVDVPELYSLLKKIVF